MSLSIGTLVGYLQLDDTQFNRKADVADKKINGLKLHLDALGKSNPKISVEVATQTKQLDELQARIAVLKAKPVSVEVNTEMVKALVDLDRLQLKIREMHNAEIKVHVDDKGARAKLDALQAKIDKMSLGSAGGLFGNIAAFGPALLPVVNMLPGALFAVGSGAVASAAGVGVLALAFHGLGTAVQAYQKYQDALPYAKNASQVAALKKTLALSAYGEQNAAGRDFTRTIATRGSAAATGIKRAAQAGVFPGADRALKDILPLVPTIEHLMKSLGTTVGDMTDKTAKALNSPFWRQWFHWLGEDAKTQLPLVGSIFGHFFQGLMQGIQRFSPQGTSLLTWLDNLMKKFSAWTGSPSFDHFMATTAADATLVGHALQAIGPVLGNIYKGLSAAGGVELQLFTGAMQVLAHLPTGAIQALGVALPIIFLGLKAIALSNSIVGGVTKIGDSFKYLATSESMAATAGRLGLIGVGLLGVATAGTETSKSLGAVQGAASGAMSGAGLGMFFGPEGAAIGGAIGGIAGGLYGLASAGNQAASGTQAAADAATAAIGPYTDYESTLSGVKAATTAATRAMVYQRLVSSGAIDSTRALGLSDREAVSAIMGHKNARAALAAALATNTTLTKAQKTVLEQEAGAIADSRLAQLQYNLAVAVGAQNIRDARKALHDFMVAPASKQVGLLGADSVLAQLKLIQSFVTGPHVIKIHTELANGPKTYADVLLGGLTPPPRKHKAAGGTVDGPRAPYGDKVSMMLAPGEEVISNNRGQADRFRPLLKAINGMAGGGTVPGDPLAGFGPGSIPSTGGHKHKGGSGKAAASKAAAARRKALQARLNLVNAQLAATNTELSAAQNWSQSFAGNAFSADLTPFEKPGPTTTSIVNGMKVTQSGATDTSPHGILMAMLGYQNSQKTQAQQLAGWVKKLQSEGVSKAVLGQMQTAGLQGIAEIQALASGTVAQVRQFNASNVATTASLNETGALATHGQTYSALQRQQMSEQSTARAIKKALAGPVAVKVVSGNLRPT